MSWVPTGEALAGDPDEIVNPNDQLAVEDTTVARPDIATDEQVISEQVFDELADRVPGWTAPDGGLITWIVEAFARVAAEIRQLVASVPDAIFQTYGTEVLGIPIALPQAAIGTSTWTAADELGYSIPIGTQFTLARTGDDLVAFEVAASAEIPPGQTTVNDVEVRAVEDGRHANGLRGEGEIVDPLTWIESITVPAVTRNGYDGQTTEQYLELLVQLMRIIALRPILPLDFAVLSLRNPAVGRAVALDLYDPETETWGHERTVTVVLTDPEGEPVPAQVRADVKDSLESLREVNFVVHVIDADYQTIDVHYEVTAFAEQNPEFVKAACDHQLETALSPAEYRLGTTSPAIVGGEVIPAPPAGEQPGRRFVRRHDLIGLLDRTRGVDWVIDVTINGGNGDVELDSATTLPRPGQIDGEVREQ